MASISSNNTPCFQAIRLGQQATSLDSNMPLLLLPSTAFPHTAVAHKLTLTP
jgi:hypothetical protein